MHGDKLLFDHVKLRHRERNTIFRRASADPALISNRSLV
jgi:hypothetical protein